MIKTVTFYFKHKYKEEQIDVEMDIIPQKGQIINLSIETESGYKNIDNLMVDKVELDLEIYLDGSVDDSYRYYLKEI